MIIYYDKQEKKPLIFNHPYITEVKKKHLSYIGDYACEFSDGTVPPVRFERKADDLHQSLTGGYRKFKNEFIRAEEAGILLIVIIEYNLNKLLKPKLVKRKNKKTGEIYSIELDLSPRIDQLFTLMVKHDIPVVFCKDRKESAEWIMRYFVALGKEHVRKKKVAKKGGTS